MQEVRSFINHYATIHGLHQPVAKRGHNKLAPTYLLSSTLRKQVHEQYLKAGGGGGEGGLLHIRQAVEQAVLRHYDNTAWAGCLWYLFRFAVPDFSCTDWGEACPRHWISQEPHQPSHCSPWCLQELHKTREGCHCHSLVRQYTLEWIFYVWFCVAGNNPPSRQRGGCLVF